MRIKCLFLGLLATVCLPPPGSAANEKLIILNEGLWQADNGKVSYFEDGVVISNEWFREHNG